MEKFIKAMDELPFIVKVLLAIFADIVISVYRIVRGLEANDTTALIVGIVTCVIPVMGIIDLILLILNKNYWYYTSTKA
jgi:multisubunit Na+/H+ antiporter MnhF subunit